MFDSLNFFKKTKTSQLGVELDHLSNLYLNPLSSQKIKKAVNFADQAHQGQFRKSGEPFIIHPINVGMILASLKMDADTIIAGLLHDVVEDCDISLAEVRKEFGKNVSKLVDGMTKLLQLDEKLKDQSQAEYFQKMALATAEDVRVVIIKLADRLHNLKTIEHLSAYLAFSSGASAPCGILPSNIKRRFGTNSILPIQCSLTCSSLPSIPS